MTPTLPLPKLLDEIGRSPGRYALFLGAGASRSSGIPTASELVGTWQKERHQAEGRYGGDGSYEVWQEQDEAVYQAWLGARHGEAKADRRYAYVFEQLRPTRAGRQEVIAALCEPAQPSPGYYALAYTMHTGLVRLVVTTNFDELVADACFDLGVSRPQVSAHSETALLMRLMSDRPKIIKLHGDYLFDDLQKTDAETVQLKSGMATKFRSVLDNYALVVLGYGGNDDSVMDVLEESSPHGFFWCVRRGTTPNERVLRLLEKKIDAYLVEIDNFDTFMVALFQAVNFDLTTQRASRQSRWERSQRVLEELMGASTPAEGVRAAEEQLTYWDIIHQGIDLHDRGNLEGAEAAYRQAIALDSKNGAAFGNLRLVLRGRGDLDGAEASFRQAIARDPKDAIHHSNLVHAC